MTPHAHAEVVPGCYRCDLSRDEVGRCGDRCPGILGGPTNFCALPAGHAGWHRGDRNEHGNAAEWTPSTDNEPQRAQEGTE